MPPWPGIVGPGEHRLAGPVAPGGEIGIEVILRLQTVAGRAILAVLVSADAAPESLRAAKDSGFPLPPKPVATAKLRALVERRVAAAPVPVEAHSP